MEINDVRTHPHTINKQAKKTPLKLFYRPIYKTWYHKTSGRKHRQNSLLVSNYSNIFLDQSPKAKEIKAKINKRDLIKFKNSCTEKETINKIKRQPTEWKKILANEADWQGLNFQNIQTAHTIQYHKTDSSIKKQAEDLNRHVSKMANKNTV